MTRGGGADHHPEPPGRPVLVLMVGPPGAGKSTLARALRALIPAEVVQTDAIRKSLVPVPTYRPAETARVHQTAQRRLRRLLLARRDVVFDATNLRESNRRALYQIANDTGADLVIVVAWAPEETVRSRLEARTRRPRPDERSDATWDVYLLLRSTFDPIPRPHVVVNTTTDLAPALQVIRRLAGR